LVQAIDASSWSVTTAPVESLSVTVTSPETGSDSSRPSLGVLEIQSQSQVQVPPRLVDALPGERILGVEVDGVVLVGDVLHPGPHLPAASKAHTAPNQVPYSFWRSRSPGR
jgi:hypothetical protein